MRLLLTILAVLILIPDVEAGGRRRQRYYVQQPAPVSKPAAVVDVSSFAGSDDSLSEVNAERAKRGLPAFIHDKLLTQAAAACAKVRAASQIRGHLPSDFDYLPPGASATAAGCGALVPSWGWGSCCTFDNYTYAGAAWKMGPDGRRYMHLFVR